MVPQGRVFPRSGEPEAGSSPRRVIPVARRQARTDKHRCHAPDAHSRARPRASLFSHGVFMHKRSFVLASLALAAAAFSAPASAQVEIQWWHAMGGALGEWVNDLAKDFNASQKDYKIVPTFKGTYSETMTAAIAAYRAGNAPH